MTVAQGQVGVQSLSDGNVSTFRQSKDGCMVVQEGHAAMQEAALRGNVWTLATAPAGVTCTATQLISSTGPAAPMLAVYNPSGSGKNLVLLYAETVWSSGTAGASGAVLGILPSAGVTAAGGNGAINNLTGIAGGSTAYTFLTSALTGQTVAHSLRRYLGGPTTGVLAASSGGYYFCNLQGSVIVPPGASAGIFTAVVGTSPIIAASLCWEEINA